jgi:hypothetical protein
LGKDEEDSRPVREHRTSRRGRPGGRRRAATYQLCLFIYFGSIYSKEENVPRPADPGPNAAHHFYILYNLYKLFDLGPRLWDSGAHLAGVAVHGDPLPFQITAPVPSSALPGGPHPRETCQRVRDGP